MSKKSNEVLSVGGHEFSNPNGWTEKQALSFYMEFLQPLVMAGNVKRMGLSHAMKEGPFDGTVAAWRNK